jgi:hypothetical protein
LLNGKFWSEASSKPVNVARGEHDGNWTNKDEGMTKLLKCQMNIEKNYIGDYAVTHINDMVRK